MRKESADGGGTVLPGTGTVKQKNHTLTIQVSPAALLLLKAVALNEANQTVEEWCEGTIAEAIHPVLARLACERSPRLFDFFNPGKGEA